MWRWLKNIFYSFRTYSDLSPDLEMRRRVRKSLRDRHLLTMAEWYQTCWQPLDVSYHVSDFVYRHLQDCSGLEFGRVRPGDRLEEDLHLTLICWFDWELSFCDDFLTCFGVDLGTHFTPNAFLTLEELMVFLNRRVLSVNHL